MKNGPAPTFILSAPCCSPDCRQHGLHSDKDVYNDACVFQVAWSINPHMKVGAASAVKALKQHQNFASVLRQAGAKVVTLPFIHGAYDSVFVKDSAIIKRGVDGVSALIANPFYEERKVESEQRRFNLKKWGVKIAGHAPCCLEGGDVVFSPEQDKVFMGYGFRTSCNAANELRRFFNTEVVPLQLRDPHFYHLDVALAVLNDGTAFACREAFTEEAWKRLSETGFSSLISVTKEEAMSFGLNWVEVNNTVVMGSQVPRLMSILRSLGKDVHYAPLDQFQLAGGSAACLVSRVYDLEVPVTHSIGSRFHSEIDGEMVLSS